MNDHVCCVCGYKWQGIVSDTDAKVRAAVKVNKDGPYCNLCLNLEMASRSAKARGKTLNKAVKDFIALTRTRKPG